MCVAVHTGLVKVCGASSCESVLIWGRSRTTAMAELRQPHRGPEDRLGEGGVSALPWTVAQAS